jgi:hypothetical protein
MVQTMVNLMDHLEPNEFYAKLNRANMNQLNHRKFFNFLIFNSKFRPDRNPSITQSRKKKKQNKNFAAIKRLTSADNRHNNDIVNKVLIVKSSIYDQHTHTQNREEKKRKKFPIYSRSWQKKSKQLVRAFFSARDFSSFLLSLACSLSRIDAMGINFCLSRWLLAFRDSTQLATRFVMFKNKFLEVVKRRH